MISLAKIWTEIGNDAISGSGYEDKLLSRKYKLSNGINCLIFYNVKNKTRQIGLRVLFEQSLEEMKKYPKWQGIDITIHDIGESRFLIFSQLEEYDAKIFEVVMQDIVDNIEKVQSNEVLRLIGKILEKWKRFFILNTSVILSESKQQVLYGELILLEKLIKLYGPKAVSYWAGWNAETHDFYINGNAIEVKTNSSNAVSNVKVSNERQLDSTDVKKNLFLYVLGVRRSKHDGEKLCAVVQRIEKLMEDSSYLSTFEENLFYSGYIESKAELYKILFFIRAEKCYNVADSFPCLTSNNMPLGIHHVSYQLDLDLCSSYEIEYTEMLDLVGRGEE